MKNHIPVMVNEVYDYLKTDSYFVDLTVGTGGHTKKMLENTKCSAICVDLDIEQLLVAKKNLTEYTGRFFLINSNYGEICNILKIKVESILIDAGISNFQIESERGFSFKNEGFLDMRFNKKSGKTAYEIIKDISVEKLCWILKEYGNVRNPNLIASKIKEKMPETSYELKSILVRYLRKNFIKKELAKIFQSLRIFVNKELENLENGIKCSYSILKDDGRLCVITYHSKEDKIVINAAREAGFKKIVKGTKPARNEIIENRKARSAKLRVFQK